MISFSCKARSRYTDSSISYAANNPGREKKGEIIWHNSFLNLQNRAVIARTEMFFWKKIMFFKMKAQQAETQTATRGVNAIKGNERHEAFADPRDLFWDQNELNMYEK